MMVLRSHSVYGFDCSLLRFNEASPNYVDRMFLERDNCMPSDEPDKR